MVSKCLLLASKVKLVAELMPYSGGLKRNIVQCLDDYDIPLRFKPHRCRYSIKRTRRRDDRTGG